MSLALGAAGPARPGPAGPPDPAKQPLPRLREDILLLPGAPALDGSPTWTLHDPAANRFLRIGWLEFEVLSRWGLGTAEAVAAAVARHTTIAADSADVLAVLRFAEAGGLLVAATPQATRRLAEASIGRRMGPFKWLLKNYLFLSVPLVRPDAFLRATLPLVAFAFTRTFLWAVLLLALLGGFLVMRQWDVFIHAFADLFTPEGLVLGALTLAGVKVLHELGHGYATRRHGCRVPTMGIAFMVLWPVLWTDTTDAWRLTDRRKRLAIDGAGIVVELAIAAIASVLWALLPDGPVRSSMHVLASATWIMTLAVNLNPFMRFDGYFLLADALDMPNLQERAFALARWRLREALFGLGDPPPEPFPRGRRRALAAYAVAIWIYRFFLFFGIALLVYHFAFKLLGLFLMAVEIGWFILRPIWNELAVWWRRRGQMRLNRHMAVTLAVLGGVVVLPFVPLQRHVTAPAILRASAETTLYAVEPGRLVAAAASGAAVEKGQTLFRVASPDLDHALASGRAAIANLQAQLRTATVSAALIGQRDRILGELASAAASLQGVVAQRERLAVVAPFAGTLVDVPTALAAGSWIGAGEPLGMVVADGPWQIEAFVGEAELRRIEAGAKGWFYREDGRLAPLAVTVQRIDTTATRDLVQADLASIYGGEVAVAPMEKRLQPLQSLYRVVLTAAGSPARFDRRAVRGRVLLEAEATSFMDSVLPQAISVLIRESGV
ncbi:MAG TPA: HlyD family efflux transporter periplasmic adaptor subunit [Alphaproteobacteria bacterium]|nr:HlyD family efflux transporter periplasmic adaptor subunit [Alphaproteobacteria bacterium]